MALLHICVLVFVHFAAAVVLPLASSSQTLHPRLYFSRTDLPFLQKKAQRPFYVKILQQYTDALNHQLNYSAGGVLSTIDQCAGCGWRHQLATTLYLANGPNASFYGDMAKQDILKQAIALTPATGNWFAGSERNLEQLIGSYDVLANLFTATETAAIESSFALNANYMYAAPPNGLGIPSDMASRLMNPAADRACALGLIALTMPHHSNASIWLSQATQEFKWMLTNGVMSDGAWHEPSTRYHGRVLAAFVPFAYALREAGEMDPFIDNNERYSHNFKKFLGWYRLVSFHF